VNRWYVSDLIFEAGLIPKNALAVIDGPIPGLSQSLPNLVTSELPVSRQQSAAIS